MLPDCMPPNKVVKSETSAHMNIVLRNKTSQGKTKNSTRGTPNKVVKSETSAYTQGYETRTADGQPEVPG